MPIAVLASMSPAFSRARSRAIFQLSYQQSTSWSSTSKLPRRSVLLCLLRWSLVPTTSSNEVGDVRFWGLADMPEHSAITRQAAKADAAMADAALAVPAVLVTAAMAASTVAWFKYFTAKLDEMKNSRRNYRGVFSLGA